MESVNLSSIDIPEKKFKFQEGTIFDTSKLDIECPEKELITEAVVKML